MRSKEPDANVDYYAILNISEEADQRTIKQAYRRAALKNHPDVSDAADARERFLKIQQAYSVLSDTNNRATYDRMRRMGQTSPFGGSSDFTGFDTDATAQEFTRRWRENNPMPNDINDSLGNIFSDLFSGVAGAVGDTAAKSGVVDDFIDFLERRVDGNKPNSSSSSSRGSTAGAGASSTSQAADESLDDVLRSKDEDVLRAEIDDARFVIDQLRQRRKKAQTQEDELRDRINQWQNRADRADKQKDFDTRNASRERADELSAEARRFEKRVQETNVHIKKQETRLRRIEQRLREVQDTAAASAASTSGRAETTTTAKSETTKRSPQSNAVNQEEAIDQELERMKRELGM